MKKCGWIKTDKGYATSCGHNGKYSRYYIYCPFCGDIINISKTKKTYGRRKLNCTDCVCDGTDACTRGAGRAVDDRICGDFIADEEV